MQMIVYDTEIICDMLFLLDLPSGSVVRYNVALSSTVPDNLKSAITCGFLFYQAHGRYVYLYSDRDLERLAEVHEAICTHSNELK